jgi:MFS family permease
MLSGLGHGFYTYGFSVFFKDIADELGLSRAVTSVGAGIGRLQGGLLSAPAGLLADKYGPKWVIFIGVCTMGMSLMLMYFIHSVWSYFVVWGFLIGTGINLGLTVTVDKTVINWFLQKQGLAQGIKFSLLSLGGIIAVPIVTWLVGLQGWRITCVIWGVVLLACAPLVLFLVKTKGPEHYGMLPDGKKAESGPITTAEDAIANGTAYAESLSKTEFTFKQAIRTRSYWFLVLAFIINTIVTGGIGLHTIPLLTDIGIDGTTAGALFSMQVFFALPSRFFGGVLADQINKRSLPVALAAALFLQAVGIGIFILYQTMFSIYIFLIIQGLSGGGLSPILTVMLGRYYGRKSFGSIFGVFRACLSPFSFLAPVYAGWIYDTTGSYTKAFIQFAVLLLIASTSLLFVRPPEQPKTDEGNAP